MSRVGADVPHTRTLPSKVISLHEMLESVGVRHQFGGAIALAWYRSPRATTNIDVNVTLPPTMADPVLGALAGLAVTVTGAVRAAVAKDGQARMDWDGTDLDVFFATVDLHQDMALQAHSVQFGPVQIPILAPEHLIACKAIYDRPEDWLDIQEIVRWGTPVDAAETLRWVRRFLGDDAEQVTRLASLLEPSGSRVRDVWTPAEAEKPGSGG